ncbi:hypothetical protein PF010_g3198 [Phytophthora fragariae]|uniref:Uncharacterized protein n=1 Tax=Phytophthora fragariae TaxID=53985 RepID=A0A6G0LUW4_9STRA|nr:hypothetical protein PF010_g3198 [Phytophthora fragariae]
MSLSGRQQTLLSIYGAVKDGNKKPLKKPQRPTSSSALVCRKKNAPRRPTYLRNDSEEQRADDSKGASSAERIEPAPMQPIASCAVVEEKVTPDSPQPAPPRTISQEVRATKSARSDVTVASSKAATTTLSADAVISLYGDGFLEIPLSEASKGPENAEPSRLLGTGGFSISMLLFKAADTEKYKARVDEDGARHKSPELDDSGEFVRWLCCGSTNRSVFGCSADKGEDTAVIRKRSEFSSVFEGRSESTSKLLSAKLRVENSDDDETTYSLYDRGVLPNYRDKGEDGGKGSVTVVLHSMASTGCFPNLEDIKKKIEAIVLFEAKRSPGEEIQIQAFRHLLALAGQSRHNRERTFMESVINRKLVLTERKVSAEFEKIGFYFASTELQEVVSYLRRIQDNYSRAQNHRMDDLPSLSMLTPTPTGLYKLPFMNTLLVSSTVMCDSGGPRSPWRFVCVLLDYDFQLVDFVHEGCPVTKRGGISYRQGQTIYNGIVDRVYLRLTALSNKVFCVLFSLQKVAEDEGNDSHFEQSNQLPRVRIQLEDVDEHHVLGMFDARPNGSCRWFTLAAAYRSKKNNQWQLQAIGGCGNATSIYASIDELNVLLAELRIIQTYEIRVHFIETGSEKENSTPDNRECEEFARRLAKNIRFGRNGRIVLVPILEGDSSSSEFRFRIALKLQEVEDEIDVYTHRNSANRALPTIQSIYRTLLRILAQHGIKECLQQNPFAPQNKRVKRHVEFRVVSAQTNDPVEKVHVFIEKNISFDALSSNLAKTVLPTLMMGSRLMSIRRRLQKKRAIEITHEVAEDFVNECIAKASKRATIAANLNLKLISVVRARAMLRRVMRQRYEKIKLNIIERARKSEHAREYSQGFPTRLQRLFTNRLILSESERDLLQHSTRGELAELDLMLRGVTVPFKEKRVMDERAFLEEWRSKKAQFASDDHPEDHSKKSQAGELNSSDNQTISEGQDPISPGDTSGGIIKDRRQLFVTDGDGRTNCRLIPGSYSLYVFHLDYFEWTSLVAVYPTISASGLYSGPMTASSSVQELVIPLDVYRWTYSLQLVDYFNPHINIKLAGIPLQITNNCSSERQMYFGNAVVFSTRR